MFKKYYTYLINLRQRIHECLGLRHENCGPIFNINDVDWNYLIFTSSLFKFTVSSLCHHIQRYHHQSHQLHQCLLFHHSWVEQAAMAVLALKAERHIWQQQLKDKNTSEDCLNLDKWTLNMHSGRWFTYLFHPKKCKSCFINLFLTFNIGYC